MPTPNSPLPHPRQDSVCEAEMLSLDQKTVRPHEGHEFPNSALDRTTYPSDLLDTESGGKLLTVIGESLIDRIQSSSELPDIAEHVGGSPLNVAVGCRRLGLPTRLITHVGEDIQGQLITDHLTDNGVQMLSGGTSPTSVATASLGPDGSASYDFCLDWDIKNVSLAALESVEASFHVHAGSIATMLMPGARTAYELVQAAHEHATVSYDPNCRPTVIPDVDYARMQAEVFVRQSDVVKASDEDLRWLYPELTLDQAMAAWLELGPALIVVTQGPLGPMALSRSSRAELPAHPVTVADTVGAGDSFMAALISALDQLDLLGPQRREKLQKLTEENLLAILSYATTASAITCSRAGANPPSLDEIGPLPVSVQESA
jgi:fructokinase